MTLDEAIKHCNEIAEAHAVLRKRYDDASGYSRSHNESIRTDDAKKHEKSNQDFIQLAGWLRELKTYKEQEPCTDAISREAALEAILTRVPDWCGGKGGNLVDRNEAAFAIQNLPSIIPKQKTGETITDYEIYTDKEGFERRVKKTTRCSLCSCDLGWNGDLLTHYCPNCGVKLEYKGR